MRRYAVVALTNLTFSNATIKSYLVPLLLPRLRRHHGRPAGHVWVGELEQGDRPPLPQLGLEGGQVVEECAL